MIGVCDIFSDQELISRLMSFFYEYDDNKDGFVAKEEVSNAFQKSGASHQTAHQLADDLVNINCAYCFC